VSRWLYDLKLQRFVPKPVSGAVAISDVGPIAEGRIVGRVSAGSGVAEELTAAQVKVLLDLVGVTADALAAKSNLDSPGFTGTPTAPTPVGSDNSTKISTTAFVQSAVVSSGRGGLTNFTESVNTTSPNATIPVVALTATNAATNVDVAIVPKGTGSFSLASANSAASGGNKRGIKAVDLQTSRYSAAQVSSGIILS
jgi:hypothetical protein